MKLQHFVSQVNEAKKLRDLGKTLSAVAGNNTIKIAEAVRPKKAPKTEPANEAGMEAAIHTITADSKHLHKKLAHHD